MNTYCIIMAGGVGSRFWPASTAALPKQFLDILGTGETLIQQTYRRMRFACKSEDFFVVTNDAYKDLVLQQLPGLDPERVLTEPLMRNTAPCIAYAVEKIKTREKNANLIVTPADHLILKQENFESVINKALGHTQKHNDLVTLGIEPFRPDTGYGYIEFEQSEKPVKRVVRFREKPDKKTAETFIKAGNFYWNSGMFIWNLHAISEALHTFLPEVTDLFESGRTYFAKNEDQKVIPEIYAQCPEISIDYAVMEKAKNVYLVKADIGWSDLGTWRSVYDALDYDENGNIDFRGKVVYDEAQNNLVKIPEDKVAVIEGLKDFIVVDSHKALLIIKKENEQKVKALRKELGERFGSEYI